MRFVLVPALVAALPVYAETIEAIGHVDRVTLFPSGAAIVRKVDVTLPKGASTLVVAGLPAETDAATLRIAAPDGVSVEATSLMQDRLPAVADRPSADVQAAQAEVDRLEGMLRTKELGVAEIRAKAEAAQQQLSFLQGLGQNRAVSGSLEDLRALTALVGEEALAARQAAVKAEAEAAAADLALKGDREALESARQVLAALTDDTANGELLRLDVEATADGPVEFEITTFGSGEWAPIYDVYLTRQGGAALTIKRGVMIAQASGEDWRGVDLTISTAQPGQRSDPQRPWPDHRSIISNEELEKYRAGLDGTGGMAEPVSEAVVVEAKSMGYTLNYEGSTVMYHFPRRVDLRSGAETLRLPLGEMVLVPEISAVAVPKYEQTAFLQAEFKNDSSEIILPGPAMLYYDGAMVGQHDMPLIAAGDRAKLGFGAIEGIRLKRTEPDRMQAQEGLITSSNRMDEVSLITVENLTNEDWRVQVLDQVAYSEQSDLVISYKASPPETQSDVEGRRGILRWDFDLAPGAKQEIRLEQTLSWPDGQVLQ